MCISFHILIFWLGFPLPHSHYTIPARINSLFCTTCLLLYLYTMDVSAQSPFQTRTGLFLVHCHTTPATHSWSGQSCNSKVVVYADTVKINPSLGQNKFHRSDYIILSRLSPLWGLLQPHCHKHQPLSLTLLTAGAGISAEVPEGDLGLIFHGKKMSVHKYLGVFMLLFSSSNWTELLVIWFMLFINNI